MNTYRLPDADTPVEVLAEMARAPERALRQAVAEFEGAPPSLLDDLAQDIDVVVRRRVARNGSAPRQALLLLAGDADPGVCRLVARNPSAPPNALALLASHDTWDVRFRVARRPDTPPRSLAVLARDSDSTICSEVCMNPAASPAVRRTAFFTALSLAPAIFGDYPPSSLPAGISEDERVLATTLAPVYKDDPLGLEAAVSSVLAHGASRDSSLASAPRIPPETV